MLQRSSNLYLFLHVPSVLVGAAHRLCAASDYLSGLLIESAFASRDDKPFFTAFFFKIALSLYMLVKIQLYSNG
jgi:hypothetical protein